MPGVQEPKQNTASENIAAMRRARGLAVY